MKHIWINIKYCIILILMGFFQSVNGQSDSSEIVKVKRSYSENEKLIDETHYDKNSRKTKFIRFNVTMGHHYLYNVDSIVRIFVYDSLINKTSEYGYSVTDSIREKNELKTEYYFNDLGKIVLKKHTDPAFSDEYFIYNLQGDLIKDSSDTVYLIEFEYSENTLWLRKSKYKNDGEHLVYHVKYEYDTLKRLTKDYYYNYDNKLIEMTTYEYDKYNNLIPEKTLHLDVYTVKRQRKDKESSYTY